MDGYLLTHPREEFQRMIDEARPPQAVYLEEGRPATSPTDPSVLANGYLDQHQGHIDGHRLRFWGGSWWQWAGASDRPRSGDDLRAELCRFLQGEANEINVGRRLDRLRDGEGGGARKPRPNQRAFILSAPLLANVLDALRGETWVSETVPQESWLSSYPGLPDPVNLLVAANGLVDLSNPDVSPFPLGSHTPALFTARKPLAFPYDPKAPPPTTWLEFLGQLWPDDPRS